MNSTAIFTTAARPSNEVETIILNNTKFAYGVAKNYVGYGVDFDDLYQEALIGLTKAAKRFDPTKGYKFTTFAVWWIKNEIMQAINANGKIVRVPCNKLNESMRLRKYICKLEQEMSRPATCEEIARFTDMSVDSVKVIMEMSLSTASLDTPVGDEDNSATFGESLAGESRADRTLLNNEKKSAVRKILRMLNEEEAKVIAMTYGLDGDGEYTDKEISEEMGISARMVESYRTIAMRKLKANGAAKRLAKALL